MSHNALYILWRELTSEQKLTSIFYVNPSFFLLKEVVLIRDQLLEVYKSLFTVLLYFCLFLCSLFTGKSLKTDRSSFVYKLSKESAIFYLLILPWNWNVDNQPSRSFSRLSCTGKCQTDESCQIRSQFFFQILKIENSVFMVAFWANKRMQMVDWRFITETMVFVIFYFYSFQNCVFMEL